MSLVSLSCIVEVMSTITFWLIVGFAAQQTIIASKAVLDARAAGVEWNQIHLIWATTVFIEITVLYGLTNTFFHLLKRTYTGRTIISLGKKADKMMHKVGENKGLLVLALISYAPLNAILAAWLEISFFKALLFLFLGQAIWYGAIIAINLGLDRWVTGSTQALVVIVVIALILAGIAKLVHQKLH